MPILAGVPVVQDVAPTRDLSKVDTRTLAFRDLDGNYPMPLSGREFFFQPDIEGIDMPPREVITRSVPGMDGERLSEIRIGRREVFLPLWIASDSTHLDYLQRRDVLAGLFNHRRVDYRTTDGTLDLVATSARGERALRCVFVEGMTSAMRPNEGAYWAKVGITLWAVQPYWLGTPWSTPVIRQSTASDWFAEFPGELASDLVLGLNIPITVPGDAESWAEVDAVGPCTALTITGPGLSVSVPGGLAAGESFRLVTNPRGRNAVFGGTRDWARVAASDRYRPLVPGDSYLNVTMVGSSPTSSAVVSGPTLWERPW